MTEPVTPTRYLVCSGQNEHPMEPHQRSCWASVPASAVADIRREAAAQAEARVLAMLGQHESDCPRCDPKTLEHIAAALTPPATEPLTGIVPQEATNAAGEPVVVRIHYGDPDDRARMFNVGFDEGWDQARDAALTARLCDDCKINVRHALATPTVAETPPATEADEA